MDIKIVAAARKTDLRGSLHALQRLLVQEATL